MGFVVLPEPLLRKLTADIEAMLTTPAVQQRILQLGNQPAKGDGNVVAGLLARDLDRYGTLIKRLNLRLE